MADQQQPISDDVAQQLAHDNDEQQRSHDTLTSEETHDDVAASAARRRASLDKEIRAGWQRALGH
ncbi:MAG TPA: hypothetical protein VIL85_29270 [Thermomicrobiales bacterium]